jgi:hypothetical protein
MIKGMIDIDRISVENNNPAIGAEDHQPVLIAPVGSRYHFAPVNALEPERVALGHCLSSTDTKQARTSGLDLMVRQSC